MKIFEEAPIDIPHVQVTTLDEDDTGNELLDRLQRLQKQKEDAEGRAQAASRPLPSLLADADDLVARVMAGLLPQDAAETAEEELQKAQANVNAANREARQSRKAITMVEARLEERAQTLYEANASHVREVHRTLVAATYEAEVRAATLLRILREFEMRYARYTENHAPEPHPQYLREAERSQPPRTLMGPAKSPNGHLYATSDATTWMQRAAALLEMDGPPVVDVDSLDFESPSATYVPEPEHSLERELDSASPDAPFPHHSPHPPTKMAEDETPEDVEAESDSDKAKKDVETKEAVASGAKPQKKGAKPE
ncbi:hypothetical protein CRI94_02950 [Longibacter salinarum]|uniref:Uncharacterized protein n=1 Tax=Longibacter salinarum TaxID=1850348 RepID=A0A2A8D2R0_9BACT|nr:hypothetical protein [Longibacter salinarum]PEN15252.1 hypothetical protein CRI94_02950 [Longibacter salinarum]